MEVKVSVDGVPRVVCGVTEKTTCQEVVIALAQALGQPGRYTLREKFKDFERSMTPDERLLESLEKYDQQAKDVQLTLLHNGPSLWDGISRAKGGRYQPCPQMRKKDAGARVRRGSGSLSLHRRSLPPLSRLRQEAEQPSEDQKKPKRKSLTLMEEAWGWLESLGKGKVHLSDSNKDSSKKSDKRNRCSMDVSVTVDKDTSAPRGFLSKVRGQKSSKSNSDHQTSCCMGNQTRDKENKHPKKASGAKPDDNQFSSSCAKKTENILRETIMCQLARLQDLQLQIALVDEEIRELEGQQRARKAEQEAQQKIIEEETEQIQFWENELKAEEVYENDLQQQFLEMRQKAVECKAKLEEYRHRMQGLVFSGAQKVIQDSEMIPRKGSTNTATEISAVSTKDVNQRRSDSDSGVNIDRKFPPKEDSNLPHAPVAGSQIKERRPTGPTELREWWARWSEAQSPTSETKRRAMHRSELTVYLGSTKV
ncbi:ras association domain-containing protein 8 [Myripristis murdjan]|uniref:ras association domain-containing protein 8 n=1 Tax=Myripristis murdjan TaxID=586833 RepID=UPI00117612A6|nr:ras association domain-containing protein 8-like [Myripristis murdjan]